MEYIAGANERFKMIHAWDTSCSRVGEKNDNCSVQGSHPVTAGCPAQHNTNPEIPEAGSVRMLDSMGENPCSISRSMCSLTMYSYPREYPSAVFPS